MKTNILSVRVMTRDDWASIRPTSAGRIQKIRDSHHIIARLISTGMTLREVAENTGYSISRISILRNTPSVIELIEHYRNLDTGAWLKGRDLYNDQLLRLRMKAARQMEEQLDSADESDEPIPLNRLISIMDSTSDRTGYHRKSSTENININYAMNLEKAIARVKSIKVIEQEPSRE